MTTNARSRPLIDDGWSRQERGAVRRERWQERQEALAARFGVSPRAVLGLVLLALAVSGVLGARVLLAARSATAVVPVAPATVGTPPRSALGSGLPGSPSGSGVPDPTRSAAAAGSALLPSDSRGPARATNPPG